ncbi:hypothetical protein BDY21DRAFT_352240 [Lineolata rhizophorae]|uniref:Uncharacterized protein n=1 Tax=Lineolata rhizophorae TaxID=578093 RepID=A0A6A6NSW8_9PEZI|nr:hypothetical protein BDY21DRAFT_352240 [Lineolata rhizophorae]
MNDAIALRTQRAYLACALSCLLRTYAVPPMYLRSKVDLRKPAHADVCVPPAPSTVRSTVQDRVRSHRAVDSWRPQDLVYLSHAARLPNGSLTPSESRLQFPKPPTAANANKGHVHLS